MKIQNCKLEKVLAGISWDGTLPIDLIEICIRNDFEYIFDADASVKEPGKVKHREDGSFFIFINTYNSDCKTGFSSDQTIRRRQRFTLAHELAHCVYNSHTNLDLQQSLTNRSNPHRKSYIKIREDQANQFAAHLLIPRKSFDDFSKKVGWKDIHKLIIETSQTFDVSLEVAGQQIAKLAKYSCIAIPFKINGEPKRVPSYSPDFAETKLFYPKSQSAPDGTLANKMLSGSNMKDVDKKEYRDASIWFPDLNSSKAEKFKITEWSIKLGQHGVLSFLEVEDLDE
jgi:hypothetical protein